MAAPAPKSATAVALKQQLERLVWDDLRVFLAVAAHASVRTAAKQLALNPSTVSRRLGALESALATQLFERKPGGVQLTSAGEEALHHAQQLDDGIRELQLCIGGHDQTVAGTIRFTCAEVLGPLVCELLPNFLERHPALDIELTITDQMVSIEKNQVDVALRCADHPPEQLIGRRVGQSAVCLYASSQYLDRHPEPLDSERHRWVEWPQELDHKPAFQWLNQHYPKRRIAVRGNSANSILRAVRAGLGVSALSPAQVAEDDSLRLLRRLPDSCSTAVWLLTHPGVQRSARVRTLMEYLGSALCTEVLQAPATRLTR